MREVIIKVLDREEMDAETKFSETENGAKVEFPSMYQNMGELIRCKDCKYHEIFFGYTNGWCNYGNGHILATIDDYCSNAERKEE